MGFLDLYLTVRTLPMGEAVSSSLLSSPLVKLRLNLSSTILHSTSFNPFSSLSQMNSLHAEFVLIVFLLIISLLLEMIYLISHMC